MKDYNTYQFSVKEYIRYLLEGVAAIAVLGGLFYQSIFGVLFLSPTIIFYCKAKKRQLIKEQKWKLNLEFRDGILSLSAALSTGYSAEHAFEEALKDLSLLYQSNSLIMQEFSYMLNQIRMNITAEKVLNDFGERSGIEDIISFAEVFATAKRTGGDLVKVIKTTCNTISDKIEVKREIITLITAKKFEANIMNIVPLMILCFLLFSSPGFLDPLYHNLFGVMVMTILLAVYLGAYLLSKKIVDIEV
ncbi:MAG TPA: type II secretion system F family protein [Mobilitalea sp.]|nr:type II secretion system F family protein [Mobilitalea sp.]